MYIGRACQTSRFLSGGYNLANAEAVAANLGVAVSAIRVDIRDAQSLEKARTVFWATTRCAPTYFGI
jgi:hypothetical protein